MTGTVENCFLKYVINWHIEQILFVVPGVLGKWLKHVTFNLMFVQKCLLNTCSFIDVFQLVLKTSLKMFFFQLNLHVIPCFVSYINNNFYIMKCILMYDTFALVKLRVSKWVKIYNTTSNTRGSALCFMSDCYLNLFSLIKQ